MSKVSTIYDQIVTTLDALFPSGSGYTRIPNAYSLADNNDNLLIKGFGFKTGLATPQTAEFNNWSQEREFNVVFTREVPRMAGSFSEFDTFVKELLEDVYTVQLDFYNVDQIGIEGTIERIELGSVSQVDFIDAGKSNYISMEATFLFDVRELL